MSEQPRFLYKSHYGSSIGATLVALHKDTMYLFADHPPDQGRSSSLIFTRTQGSTETLYRFNSSRE